MTFDALWKIAEQCSTRVSRDEGKLLWELSAKYDGHIVEVGTCCGGTARILGHNAEHLTCIDPWQRDTKDDAIKHLEPILHKTTVLSASDFAIWPMWTGEIELLFLDHDHSYEGTLDSIRGWRRHLVGPLVIHDYGNKGYSSVSRAVKQSGLVVEQVVDMTAVCWYGG